MLERGAGILTRTRFFLPLGTSLFRRSAATPNDEERGDSIVGTHLSLKVSSYNGSCGSMDAMWAANADWRQASEVRARRNETRRDETRAGQRRQTGSQTRHRVEQVEADLSHLLGDIGGHDDLGGLGGWWLRLRE